MEEFFYGLPMFIWKDLKTKEMHNTNKHGAFKSSWNFLPPPQNVLPAIFEYKDIFAVFPFLLPFLLPFFCSFFLENGGGGGGSRCVSPLYPLPLNTPLQTTKNPHNSPTRMLTLSLQSSSNSLIAYNKMSINFFYLSILFFRENFFSWNL